MSSAPDTEPGTSTGSIPSGDLQRSPELAPECGLRERKKRQARADMHRAALELVAEHGLDSVTVEMIAERAGISPRTFFNHWASKESAVLGLPVLGPDESWRALLTVSPGATPEQALREVLRQIIRTADADLGLRELKKRVLHREPSLHAVSAGRTAHMQSALIAAFERRVRVGPLTQEQAEELIGEDVETFAGGAAEDPQLYERAVIAVQLGFAVSRSAFSLSMARGTTVLEEFDHVSHVVGTRRITS
ncbi:TetR/AcrR family transcriptional regulator [Brachybacterium sp. NPDC056505]|uniref:TetR/AcrR family transcriptional regulator n=1 Tax=Brachybacterium sp. NPDC056505 TaxID=3345843 RepID=UPI00366D8D52